MTAPCAAQLPKNLPDRAAEALTHLRLVINIARSVNTFGLQRER
jgi:DNA-directed RNA polymerase sigma subunit (sigma70/sigma32)